MKGLAVMIPILLLLIGHGALPTTADAPAVKGSGRDASGLAFDFRASGDPVRASGRAAFETVSFGVIEGGVSCLNVAGHRAILAGEIDNPTPTLTHFVIVAEDRADGERGRRDRLATSLRDRPFDCATEPDGDLAADLGRVKKGGVVVD